MTDIALSNYHLQKKYPIGFSAGNGVKFNSGFYVMEHMQEISHYQRKQEIRDHFNLDHFICLIDCLPHYDDVYVFATTPDKADMINKIVNNLDIVKHFILYFKDKSAKLLQKAPRIIYPDSHFGDNLLCKQKSMNKHDNCEAIDLIHNLAFKKIEFTYNKQTFVISRREYDCLRYLARGDSYKQIAQHLQLSPRTVETYLNNVKLKLNLYTKQQVITMLQQVYLFN